MLENQTKPNQTKPTRTNTILSGWDYRIRRQQFLQKDKYPERGHLLAVGSDLQCFRTET